MPNVRNRRKRYRRKRLIRRKKNSRYSRGIGANAVRYFKLRQVGSLTSDGSGVIKLSLSDNPTGLQDWNSVSSLFDNYRVCALKVNYYPEYPNDAGSLIGYKGLYIVYDPDSSTSPLTSIATTVEYENCKVKNMYRPWSYYAKLPKLSSNGASHVVLQGGWLDMATATGIGGIFGYGTGFNVSTTYGQLVYTFYIKCKNRR